MQSEGRNKKKMEARNGTGIGKKKRGHVGMLSQRNKKSSDELKENTETSGAAVGATVGFHGVKLVSLNREAAGSHTTRS